MIYEDCDKFPKSDSNVAKNYFPAIKDAYQSGNFLAGEYRFYVEEIEVFKVLY